MSPEIMNVSHRAIVEPPVAGDVGQVLVLCEARILAFLFEYRLSQAIGTLDHHRFCLGCNIDTSYVATIEPALYLRWFVFGLVRMLLLATCEC